MPRKFPPPDELLNKVKDTAAGALKDPKGTSGRLFVQAKDAAGVGRHLAEGLAAQFLEQVNARTRHRRAADAPRAETHAVPSPEPRKAQGDPVAPHHPATAAPSAEPVPSTEARVEARKATPADVAKKATVKGSEGAPAKKPVAKKSPAKKAPPKKSPAKKAPAKKAPAKKTPAKKTPAKKTPAQEAPVEGLATKVTESAEPTDSPGDKLPPRAATTPAPPPPPTDIESNPEATPPSGP